jgi:hypothetical protein
VQSDFFSILADDDVLLSDFLRLAMESFAAPALVVVGSTVFTATPRTGFSVTGKLVKAATNHLMDWSRLFGS